MYRSSLTRRRNARTTHRRARNNNGSQLGGVRKSCRRKHSRSWSHATKHARMRHLQAGSCSRKTAELSNHAPCCFKPLGDTLSIQSNGFRSETMIFMPCLHSTPPPRPRTSRQTINRHEPGFPEQKGNLLALHVRLIVPAPETR